MKEYIFRDPVHGHISVCDPIALAVIGSPEFQRLRRIRQLGASFMSYPGAEHTRFAHSLGVYHLMGRVLSHFRSRSVATLSDEEVLIAQLAALLHDVGHGPFSHAFEKITGEDHEARTAEIVMGDTRVAEALRSGGADWPAQVLSIFQGAGYLRQLLASQVDVDRMDYLLRDTVMCGVPYGQYDLERLIHTMTLHDGQLVIHHKGQLAVEEFLLARYFMYWNVYFHKATRSAEVILQKALQRAADLVRSGAWVETPPALLGWLLGRRLSLGEYLALDEVDLLFVLKTWRSSTDRILADLADRFVNRRLFGAVPTPQMSAEEVEARLEAAGFDPQYYYHFDVTSNVSYSFYYVVGGSPPIWLLDGSGRLAEISTVSDVLKSISTPKSQRVLYVPKEVLPALQG